MERSRKWVGSDAGGYTFAELLAVVTVVGVLALIGVPAVLGYLQTTSVREAARELQAGLNRARATAIMTHRNICVALSGTTGYQMLQDSCAGTALTPDDAPSGVFTLGNNMTLGNAGNAPVFTPFGTASPGAVFTVQEPGGASGTVTVAVSGRVSVP
jgi:Tfp pilus assembly protein FimT